MAGRGGNGCVAFRREKFAPHGGPAGGDGGKGGDVVLFADEGMSTLLDLTYQHTLQAEAGEPGRGKDQYGAGGEDLVVHVPVGTQVFDKTSGALLFDITTPGSSTIIAHGGRGGRGNIHFATSYDRAPRRAEPGEDGQELSARFELKVMADVGLLGFPNAGKSTFIRAVSRARPKVADYPFTTLVPHLGVVQASEDQNFVIADIPGLIPGASEGVGLGIQFLKHVERTRALLHLITLDPGEGREPMKDYLALRAELKAFDKAGKTSLSKRPEVVALSKADLTDVRDAYPALARAFAKKKIKLHLVSAATGASVRDVILMLAKTLATKVPSPKVAPKKRRKPRGGAGLRRGSSGARK